jgi:hypothetical protein
MDVATTRLDRRPSANSRSLSSHSRLRRDAAVWRCVAPLSVGRGDPTLALPRPLIFLPCSPLDPASMPAALRLRQRFPMPIKPYTSPLRRPVFRHLIHGQSSLILRKCSGSPHPTPTRTPRKAPQSAPRPLLNAGAVLFVALTAVLSRCRSLQRDPKHHSQRHSTPPSLVITCASFVVATRTTTTPCGIPAALQDTLAPTPCAA